MKISDLKNEAHQDEQGVTFDMLQPDGEPYDDGNGGTVQFTVVGKQSQARRKAEDTESRRLLRAGRTTMEPEDLRARRITLAAACVQHFTGLTDEAGTPLPVNLRNVREILGANERWLEQVEEKIEKHSSFLPKA